MRVGARPIARRGGPPRGASASSPIAQDAVVGLAEQPATRSDDGVQHRLHVGRRTGDDLQHLRRRVCRSSASCVSLNSRAFSMAITAWSAKVLIIRASTAEKGLHSRFSARSCRTPGPATPSPRSASTHCGPSGGRRRATPRERLRRAARRASTTHRRLFAQGPAPGGKEAAHRLDQLAAAGPPVQLTVGAFRRNRKLGARKEALHASRMTSNTGWHVGGGIRPMTREDRRRSAGLLAPVQPRRLVERGARSGSRSPPGRRRSLSSADSPGR